MNMQILGVIPARSGSKRLPNKNKLLLFNKPLFRWSVDAALGVHELVDVLVTSDDEDILRIVEEQTSAIALRRPRDLSRDDSETIDAVLHAIQWYENQKEKLDAVVLLQPTSPFRKSETISKAINIFESNGNRSVVSFSPLHARTSWVYINGETGLDQLIKPQMRLNETLKQELILNGAIYIATPQQLKKERSFINRETIPFIMEPSRETLDIDTEWDFEVAKLYN